MRNNDIGSEQTPEVQCQLQPVDRPSSHLQCGEQRACALFSLSCCRAQSHPRCPPTSSLQHALVKAPGLLMQIKWWRGRGWGGEFARAQLLSTHTHSVQLLLLHQLRSVYKVPSIEEDKPTGYCTGCSPEQDVSQRLGPRVTWQETTGQTASVEEIYFTFSLLQLVLPAIRRQIIHMEKATTMTMGN